MVNEQVRVPAGVPVAAVVLALMAFLGLLFVACTAFAMLAMQSPLIPRIPTVRFWFGALDFLILALVAVSACTIVGLLRLKSWARYSMMLLGLLDFLAFAVMSVGVLIGRAQSGMTAMAIPNNPHITLGGILLAVAVLLAALALVGAWWVIYFNLKTVGLAFTEAEMYDALPDGQ